MLQKSAGPKIMNKYYTWLFYSTIGVVAGLGLFLVFYWHLRLNSSIESLFVNTVDKPVYFWLYVLLTLGAIVLFGVNVALFVYRSRKFGLPKIGKQAGSGLGSLVGIAAAACPVCGSFLLSAVGITGGLAAFPFGGLELKALSFGLLAIPVFLTAKDLRNKGCENGVCPIPKDASFGKKDKIWLFGLVVLIVTLSLVGVNMLASDPIVFSLSRKTSILNPNDNKLYSANVASEGSPLYKEVVAKVLPESGFQSKIYLGDSVVKLVESGVIDKKKFEEIYKDRGGLPAELAKVLEQPSEIPILLTRQNANYYVNFLWPLGLANYMSTNKKSPILPSLFNLASTGGWNLGKEENGGAYFNKFKIVELTPQQEALVTKIAQNSYRPCCDNSTFYQDCNHGSALLGLLQLGASQGLTEDELYKEALAFNSLWFPHNYIQTALYFKIAKNTDWGNVDAKEVMGYNYSAISQWSKNVRTEIAKIPNLLPQTKGGSRCGV